MKKPSDLKNLGPISEQMLARVGITSADELLGQDPVDVFILLKLFGFNVTNNMLLALHGAINDIEIAKIDPKEKKKLIERAKQAEAG